MAAKRKKSGKPPRSTMARGEPSKPGAPLLDAEFEMASKVAAYFIDLAEHISKQDLAPVQHKRRALRMMFEILFGERPAFVLEAFAASDEGELRPWAEELRAATARRDSDYARQLQAVLGPFAMPGNEELRKKLASVAALPFERHRVIPGQKKSVSTISEKAMECARTVIYLRQHEREGEIVWFVRPWLRYFAKGASRVTTDEEISTACAENHVPAKLAVELLKLAGWTTKGADNAINALAKMAAKRSRDRSG